MRRPALLFARFALVLLVLIPGLSCRRTEAVEQSPVEKEAEELLVRYIRIDTSNPPGNETRAALLFREIFEAEGIESHLVGDDPARQSIYARLDSGTEAPALLLLHHLDVVPAVPSEWSVPPFEGRRAGGYIWGRGALDIKSLGIAHLMGFLELHRTRAPLARDVIFLGVADEEAGGTRGLESLLETRPELFENVGWVLNEGGANETIVDRNTWWGIEVDQKIPLWVRLVAKGEAGHGALPPPGGGAPMRLVEALSRVAAIPTPWRLTPTVAAYLRSLSEVKYPLDVKKKIFADPEAWFGSKEMEQLPTGALALLRDTVSVTVIRAGETINSIPPTASAEIDVRLLPGTDPEAFLASIREAAGTAAEVEVLLRGEAIPPSPLDTALFEIVARAAREASPGSKVGPYVSAGTSDSRYFRARGVVAYGFNPFLVNYYDGATIHAPDERIRARFFAAGVRLMRRVVREAATAPAAPRER